MISQCVCVCVYACGCVYVSKINPFFKSPYFSSSSLAFPLSFLFLSGKKDYWEDVGVELIILQNEVG